ncbi:Aste57867_23967 [Aphanomyces stellatus]|uniref:Aste57867_23967 protein n=1 Tax=Aphanomyces stellatus TaxID=120398 RepID=A0A485LP55_9STRA|nr:hypothetical protein As57867_023894 [Aphanomyces stellatus]VFU00610.1 Aste57867_23967 [Aphanomyces stellatus]
MALLGREEQMRTLVRLLGGQHDDDDDSFLSAHGSMMYPIVVAHGYNSTGKSSCVRLAVQKLQRTTVSFTAFVDCTTAYTRKQVFTDILRQIDPLARSQPDELTDSFQIQPAADGYHNLNFLGFLQCMSKIVRTSNLVVVLDNVDKLLTRGMADLLRSLCRLPEELHVSMRCSFILVTRGICPRLEKLLAPFFPAFVPFPLYTPAQLSDILVDQFKMWDRERAFRAWVKLLHGLFEHDCHDWVDFRSLVIQLLPLFDQHIDPDMPFDASKAAYKQLVQQTQSRIKSQWTATVATPPPSDTVNLPFGCLLLVLASYLASFNPQASDMTFFTTAQRKKTRRKVTPKVSSKNAVPQQLLGPKAFPMQRLLAIYHSLHDEYEPPAGIIDDDAQLSRRDAFAQV